ncbi:hypothetical protein A6X21_18405 [Planctopirus hydrillae]|uniref:SLA1 homology domain-containing protein n=2 Tax=Planctopirus hydrillae TaxID=1841610 RepID=A0A1C3EKD9_9PLAN|nr:hypothetical protein A6X21_18405 [Planctopirus hydrillae]
MISRLHRCEFLGCTRRQAVAASHKRMTNRAAWLSWTAGLLLVLSSSSLPAQESRTWTDATGKFKIDAKFVSLEGTKVTLLQTSGEEIEIDLSKLSPGDRKVAQDLAKKASENPFQVKETNPFAPKAGKSSTGGSPAGPSMPDRTAPGGTEPAPAAGNGTYTGRDAQLTSSVDGVTELLLTPQSDKLALPRNDAVVDRKLPSRGIALPKKANFFEKANSMLVHSSKPEAVVLYHIAPPGQSPITRVVVLNLETGKITAQGQVPNLYTGVAYGSDGLILVRQVEHHGKGNKGLMEGWIVKGKDLAREWSWEPAKGQSGRDEELVWGEILPDGRVLTANEGGKITCWKTEGDEMKALWRLQAQGSSRPDVTRDGKYMAIVADKQCAVMDLEAGEVVATVPTKGRHLPWPRMAISAEHSRMACFGFDKIIVWDLQTGEEIREIATGPISGGAAPLWLDDDFLLLGGHLLVDVKNQLRLWDYTGAEMTTFYDRTGLFVVGGPSQSSSLIPIALPHPAAKNYLARALQDPNLFILKEGTQVAIDVSGIQDAAQQAAIKDKLTAKLTQRGFVVGASGSIILKASTETGKSEKMSYRSFGEAPWNAKEYNVQSYISRLKFVWNGKDVWEGSGNNIPGFLSLSKDETIEQALKKHEKPNYHFFEHCEIPKLLTKPAENAAAGSSTSALGKSTVTISGLQ